MTHYPLAPQRRLSPSHHTRLPPTPCSHLLSSARGDAAALHCPLGALRQPPFEPPQR